MPSELLTQNVTGPLAAAERAAIEAIGRGEKFRTSVSLDPAIALAAVRAAAREHRDFSGLCCVALAEYERINPAPSREDTALFAKLEIAIQRNPALKPALEKLARQSARAKRARIAA